MADITSSEGEGGRAARLAAATERAIEAVRAASPGLELSAACEALTGQPWALRTVAYPEWPSVTLHGAPAEQRKWLAVGLRAGFEFSQGEKIETERWRMLQGELDAARRERDHYRKALDGCLTRLERANVVLEAAVKLVDHWIDDGFRSDSPERAELEAGLRDAVRAFQAPVEPSGPVRVVSRQERQGMGEPADVENATVGVDVSTSTPTVAYGWHEFDVDGMRVRYQIRGPFDAKLRNVQSARDLLAERDRRAEQMKAAMLQGVASTIARPKRRPIIDRILGRVCRLEARQGRLAERVKRLEELAPRVVDDFTPGPGAPVGWVGHVRGGQVQAVTPPPPAGTFSEDETGRCDACLAAIATPGMVWFDGKPGYVLGLLLETCPVCNPRGVSR